MRAGLTRLVLMLSLACLAACALAAPAGAATPTLLQARNGLDDGGLREIIVKRAPRLTASERGRVRARAGATHVRSLRLRDTEVVRVSDGRLDEALARLNADPDVRHAEPNGRVEAQSADAHWDHLWGLHNRGQTVWNAVGTADADIDAPEAWSRSTGSGQTVAVVDSGVHFGHEDLQGQFAATPGESGAGRETNGIDDDRNGLVDDHRGWDFVGDDNDPTDGDGHGTHVAGTIAAKQDNALGVTGVAPGARLLTLRVLDDNGVGSLADVADAFDLAGDLGIKTVNASLGGATTVQSVGSAIAAHPETLYVVAAGNGGDDAVGDDNESTAMYPCNLPLANLVCVGATGSNDASAIFSNHGTSSVDLHAPGVNIASTYIDAPASGCGAPCYVSLNGTSMASPHVAATFALMRASNPDLSATALKRRLLAAADIKAELLGTSVTGARLNADAAVLAALDSDRDGISDSADNCASLANPDQANVDGDALGDVCDLDEDGDGAPDTADNCLTTANASQADADGDAQGDACDATARGEDADGDGAGALDDNCPAAANAGQGDRDGDAVGDICDPAPDGVPSLSGPAGPSAPVLGRPTLSRTTITSRRPALLRFTLDRAATVTLAVRRRSGARHVRVRTVTLHAAAGTSRYVLRTRVGRTTLRPGRYRLIVSARAGELAALTAFRLRFAV